MAAPAGDVQETIAVSPVIWVFVWFVVVVRGTGADVAQMVEHRFRKAAVGGSMPFVSL